MAAIVTCAKRIAAFSGGDGVTTYALFEETMRRTCIRTGRSGECRFVGDADGALERIFGWAASCEGGLLVSRRGWTTPEAYIAGWLTELANPVLMADCEVRLWTADSFFAPIQPAIAGQVQAVLASRGLAEAAREVQSTGSAPLRLHAHAAAIRALCREPLIPAWRLVAPHGAPPLHAPRDPELGYAAVPGTRHPHERPRALKVDRDVRLLQREDGSWHCAGWSYGLVGAYVRDAWKGGLEETRHLRARIRAYRAALEHAPPMPAGTRVVVTEDAAMDDRLRRLCAEIRAGHPVTPTVGGFEVEAVPELLYKLAWLGPTRAAWSVPGTAAVPSPPRQPALL